MSEKIDKIDEIENLELRKIKSTKREAIVNIEKWAGDGVCLAHDENDKVLFVQYAIPGEKVKVNIYKEAKDYAIGEVQEILETSPLRIKAACPFFTLCGGCDLQMLAYPDQIKLKKQVVQETFKRIAGIDIERFSDVISSPDPFYYRNTITLKVNPKKKKIGFFRKNTKSIVSIDQCMISKPGINQALEKIIHSPLSPPHNFKIRTTDSNDTVVNWIKTEHYEDRSVNEKITAGRQTLQFKISKDNFFQVNNSVIPLWLNKIISFLDHDRHEKIFDLYCGIGLITLFVSYYARETIGIEISRQAIKDAINNVEVNQIKTQLQFFAAPVEDKIIDLGQADVVIVDPPRKGMDKTTIETLLTISPGKIIYSSCKPSTMARDIQMLSERYQIKEMVLVDMFPQTHHVELLSLLEKK